MIPITQTERDTALAFAQHAIAQQQTSRRKAQQVYRNTLAVLAVKRCLDQLDIPTALTESASWNPFSQLIEDAADLALTGLGRLECRPVEIDALVCQIPDEAMEDRIGYVAVQIDPSHQAATLLGFLPEVSDDAVPIQQFQPIEHLWMHLETIQLGTVSRRAVEPIVVLAAPTPPPSPARLTQLHQWFEQAHGINEALWQQVEAVLGDRHQRNFAFRQWRTSEMDSPQKLQQLVEQLYASQGLATGGSPQPSSSLSAAAPPPGGDPATSDAQPDFQQSLAHLIQTTRNEELRWKAAEILWSLNPNHPATAIRRVMDLGIALSGRAIALMVAILRPPDAPAQAEANRRTLSVLLRVYPTADAPYLPTHLTLRILDAQGNPGLVVQARERDNYIQLKFLGEIGERFGIQLALDQHHITEYCVI
jgi:hypothetical protein